MYVGYVFMQKYPHAWLQASVHRVFWYVCTDPFPIPYPSILLSVSTILNWQLATLGSPGFLLIPDWESCTQHTPLNAAVTGALTA